MFVNLPLGYSSSSLIYPLSFIAINIEPTDTNSIVDSECSFKCAVSKFNLNYTKKSICPLIQQCIYMRVWVCKCMRVCVVFVCGCTWECDCIHMLTLRNYTREINGMNLINHARYCIGIKIFAGEEMVSPLGMLNMYLIKYTYSGGQMEMKIGSNHGNWLELTCHTNLCFIDPTKRDFLDILKCVNEKRINVYGRIIMPICNVRFVGLMYALVKNCAMFYRFRFRYRHIVTQSRMELRFFFWSHLSNSWVAAWWYV